MPEQYPINRTIIAPTEGVDPTRIKIQEYDRPFYLTSDMNVQAIK